MKIKKIIFILQTYGITGLVRAIYFRAYPIALWIDNCNFVAETVWEGSIKEGQTFQSNAKKPSGQQYLAEATDLEGDPSETYDFVLSSHMLEHTANLILALTEWIRILKDQGILSLSLPHKDATFDHQRTEQLQLCHI